MAIGGIGMGSLGAIAQWVGGLATPLGQMPTLPEGFQPPEGMGGVGAIPGVDFGAMRTAMQTLQEKTQKWSERDQRWAETKEQMLELDKDEFFEKYHYEFDSAGNRKVVEGAETRAQARQRIEWENGRLEAVKEQQEARASNPDWLKNNGYTALAQLNELQSKPGELEKFLLSEGGQKAYMDLAERATIEEETLAIRNRADEFRATYPPRGTPEGDAIRNRIGQVEQMVIDRRNQTRKDIQDLPQAQLVAEYKALIEAHIAGLKEMAQNHEWTPPKMPDFIQPTDGSVPSGQPTWHGPTFQPPTPEVALADSPYTPVGDAPLDPSKLTGPGGIPVLNPAIYDPNNAGATLLNPDLLKHFGIR